MVCVPDWPIFQISNAWDLIPLLFPYCSQYNSLLYSIVSTLTKMRDNHAGCVIVGRSGVRVCEGVGSCHKNWVLQKKAFIPKNLYPKNSGWYPLQCVLLAIHTFFIRIQFIRILRLKFSTKMFRKWGNIRLLQKKVLSNETAS